MTAFMYAVLTACVWGIVPVIEKIGLGKVDPGIGIFYRGFGVLIGMSFLAVMYTSKNISFKADLKSIILLVLGGLLASFIGQFFFYRSLKMGEASLVVPVAAMYPLVSFIIAVTALNERITPGKICGMILVIAGVVLLKGK
ncbi:MAG: EamA family transporter [bacterium]